MAPRRTREHELETLSRQEFERLVPASWVVREVSRDYGVDLEVEIFENGETTGLTFKVQLKASEKTSPGGPSRRVKTGTLGYWKGLDVPVLIAYYAADTGLMYGRWAHTVGREPGFDRDAKTTTVLFSDDEVLAPERIESRLPDEVAVVRSLRAGRFPRPLPVRLVAADDSIPGVTAARLRVRLRQGIRERGLDRDVRLVAPDETGPAVEVSLAKDADMILRAALPTDLATIRVVLPADLYGPGDTGGMLTDDVLVAVAFVVDRTGAGAVAARLLGASAIGSVLPSLSDIPLLLASVLAEHGPARTAQRLAIRGWDSAEAADRGTGDVYYSALLHQVGDLTASEQGELADAMRRRAETELAEGDRRSAGRAYYNLAQVLNATARTPDALDAMDAAVRHDPGYDGRDYFFRERAGMRWHTGRFAGAADDYRRAISLSGDEGELVPLLADALLGAGRYADAERVLADWSPTGHRLDGLAVLLRLAVGEVRAVTGLDAQDRAAPASDVVEAAADDPADLVRLLATHDALDPRIWFRLSQTAPAGSLPRLVLVAVMLLNSAAAWAAATVSALTAGSSPDPEVVRALIEAGQRLSDTPYADAIETMLDEIDDPESGAQVRDAVYDVLHDLHDETAATTLRFVFD